jgi:hypothetical protein
LNCTVCGWKVREEAAVCEAELPRPLLQPIDVNVKLMRMRRKNNGIEGRVGPAYFFLHNMYDLFWVSVNLIPKGIVC